MSELDHIKYRMLDLVYETQKAADWPELTEIERAEIAQAKHLLERTWTRVCQRFANAPPGSTTFSVLGQ
jgi:hypothetical protein